MDSPLLDLTTKVAWRARIWQACVLLPRARIRRGGPDLILVLWAFVAAPRVHLDPRFHPLHHLKFHGDNGFSPLPQGNGISVQSKPVGGPTTGLGRQVIQNVDALVKQTTSCSSR